MNAKELAEKIFFTSMSQSEIESLLSEALEDVRRREAVFWRKKLYLAVEEARKASPEGRGG